LLRGLDRAVGIPVVAAAGALRRKRQLPGAIRRIGIINSTAIGDTIVLSPVIADIARRYAAAETVVFASEAMVPLLRQLDRVTPVAFRIAQPRDAIRAIRRERVDVLLDFDSWPRVEPVYSLCSGSAFAAGFRARGQHRHYAYDASVDHSSETHEIENFRRLAELIDVRSQSLPRFSPQGRLPVSDLPKPPYVVFHLWPTGIRSSLKEWPPERWRALARELAARGETIVLTGGPADAARSTAFAASLPDLGDTLLDRAGRFNLEEILDLVNGSGCVVSVNTGIAHLAAAVGAPTVTLNGPTAERRWAPLGSRAVSINSELPGCGYLSFGWEYKGHRTDCMEGIRVEKVLEVVLGALGA
jgi:heptosyltransferase III